MASNARTVVVPNNGTMIRRAGGLIAQSASGLVNVPGLKDAVLFAKEGAKALKAPKANDAQAKKQIDRINGLLNHIESVNVVGRKLDLLDSRSPAQGEHEEIQSFRQNIMSFKSELERALIEKQSIKFARQGDIVQFLMQKNEQVSECVANFCVAGGIRAHHAMQMHLESTQRVQAFSIILVEQSNRMSDLEYQIQTLQRLRHLYNI